MRSITFAVLMLLSSGSVSACPESKPDDPTKPAERKIKFNARGLPWNDVFQWLAKETGKPVITSCKLAGSFTGQVPEGAAYTLPQTIDCINEVLFEQHAQLVIQRKLCFVVLPPNALGDVEQVAIADLSKHGNTEIVEVVLPLKDLDAVDCQLEVKRMMGKYGEVVASRTPNSLRMKDRVGTLKRLCRTLCE